MDNELTIQDLFKVYECDSVADLFGYIAYLEGVKADYEYMKEKFKCFVAEIDQIY